MSAQGWGTALQIIGDVGESVSGMIGSIVAGHRQKEAISEAEKQLATYYQKALDLYSPYQKIGLEAMQQLRADVRAGKYIPEEYKPYVSTEAQPTAPTGETYGKQPEGYKAAQFDYRTEPGYQAALQQGTQAIQSQAAGAGQFFSGATQKALARYGTGMAAQDYGNQYNRYMAGRQQTYQEYLGSLNQYNENRRNAQAMYELALQQFGANRQFGAGQAAAVYQSRTGRLGEQYSQLANLANLGPSSAQALAGLATEQGANLSNLALQSGNVGAATAQGVAAGAGNIFRQASNYGASMGGMGGGGGKQDTGYRAGSAPTSTLGQIGSSGGGGSIFGYGGYPASAQMGQWGQATMGAPEYGPEYRGMAQEIPMG